MMHSMSLSLVPVHGEAVAGTAAHSVGARLIKPKVIRSSTVTCRYIHIVALAGYLLPLSRSAGGAQYWLRQFFPFHF